MNVAQTIKVTKHPSILAGKSECYFLTNPSFSYLDEMPNHRITFVFFAWAFSPTQRSAFLLLLKIIEHKPKASPEFLMSFAEMCHSSLSLNPVAEQSCPSTGVFLFFS